MRNPEEAWQVDVDGKVYDTTFAELTVWIAESSLLEEDKVRRGNLRWLEAGKVPPLRPFFDAKANGTEPPAVQISVTEQSPENEVPSETSPQNIAVNAESQGFEDQGEVQIGGEEVVSNADAPVGDVNQDVCNVHPELESVYVCEACLHGFCKQCPQSFGSNVKVCPYCGGMCRPKAEMGADGAKEERIRADIGEGFGFGDYLAALGYPFNFKSSLLFGGLIVAVLGYGQAAAGMGSYFLIGAAIICFILSTAFVFGMLANTVDNFAKGEIDSDFLPKFDDFSAWDDVVHPFFLGIGAFLSSFGLATALTLGLVWYTFNTIVSQFNSPETQIEQLTAQSDQSATHIDTVKQKLQRQNQGRTDIQVGADGLTDAQRRTLEEEAEFQELNDLANNYRKTQIESTIGKSPETRDAEMRQMVMAFAQTAGIFIILIGLALLWGFFYWPAACAVAGYTRSFAAAINPAVGLDTIRHLGLDYVKILLMSFSISITSGIISGIFAIIFSPFDLPSIGNIPANFAASFVGFFFWVVFAVVLGRALYKNSDKLALHR